jgi:RNA polymerase sigma-70 factor (family 1)
VRNLRTLQLMQKVINKFEEDKVLIQYLKKGDEQAYTHLTDKYHHLLCVFANSLVRNNFQSEDIVQNVLLNIWTKRTYLNEDINIKNFLLRSVKNEFIDQYRKNKSTLAIEKIHIKALDFVMDENEHEATEHMIKILKLEIQKLPPKCKEIFILSKQEGLTNLEISIYLQINIKTVEAQITKAFNKLREKIGGNLKALFFWIHASI